MNKKVDYSKIYSPTKLGMFSQCPKSYHFSYLDPIYSKMKNELKKYPDNIWSFYTLGKAVHNAITLFYYSPPKERTEQQLKENLKETWRSEVKWNKKPPLGEWGGFETIEEERESYSQALSILKNFLRIAEIDPQIEYLPTKNFKRSIDDYHDLINPLSESFSISGKFDLVVKNPEGYLEIIDFKTGKKNDNYFQLKFYKLLAEIKFKKQVSKASFYFLRSGDIEEFDLDKQGTGEIKDEVIEKINQILLAKEFEPRPSRLCRFCLFKTFCPEKEKVNEIVKDVTKEDYTDDLPF